MREMRQSLGFCANRAVSSAPKKPSSLLNLTRNCTRRQAAGTSQLHLKNTKETSCSVPLWLISDIAAEVRRPRLPLLFVIDFRTSA